MSLTITRRDIERAHAAVRHAHGQMKSVHKPMERITGQLTQSLEVSAGAFGAGYMTGRLGEVKLGSTPIPLDLVGAVVLHGLGFMDMAGKYNEHVHNIADGMLASYMMTTGIRLMKPKGPATSGDVARMHGGMPAAYSGAALTEAELAAMAQAMR